MNTAVLRQEDISFQATLYESQNLVRRWLHNSRREWVMKTLESISPSRCKYLEVGIGCGIYTKEMSMRGWVTAIDINELFVKEANRLSNVKAQVADIMETRFPARHHVAVCSEVIEHIPDSLKALRNIRASLNSQGYLILTTPNSYSTMEIFARLLAFGPIVKLARLIYGESVDDLGHINRLTRHQLRDQIEKAGFTVIRQNNIGLYIPVIAEFGGRPGLALSQWLATWMAQSPLLSNLLWTQCWLLRKRKGESHV